MKDGMAETTKAVAPNFLASLVLRDGQRHDAIRAEIEQNGTAWAADEIDRLRHKVVSLQARLTAAEGRDR